MPAQFQRPQCVISIAASPRRRSASARHIPPSFPALPLTGNVQETLPTEGVYKKRDTNVRGVGQRRVASTTGLSSPHMTNRQAHAAHMLLVNTKFRLLQQPSEVCANISFPTIAGVEALRAALTAHAMLRSAEGKETNVQETLPNSGSVQEARYKCERSWTATRCEYDRFTFTVHDEPSGSRRSHVASKHRILFAPTAIQSVRQHLLSNNCRCGSAPCRSNSSCHAQVHRRKRNQRAGHLGLGRQYLDLAGQGQLSGTH